MRNLKRALSLALASVMVLGLMVVGSSAKGYDDVTSEENVEAIEVLQAVGIMTGDENGNFNPTQNVTRNEMAVIMSNLMDFRVATYKGTSPFTDVPEWAEPYVAACYTNGIIAGYSATTFGGSDPVVTSQATLMVLKALGYFQSQQDFGEDWQLATVNQANRVDLLVDVDSAVRVPMTRNDVAQLVLNGLEAGTVEADNSNTVNVTIGDAQVSVGGTKYNFVTSGQDYAGSINRKLATGNDGEYSNGYIVELGEKLYQGSLTKLSSEDYQDRYGTVHPGHTDAFERPANHWEFEGKEIGTYTEVENTSFTKKVTTKALYNAVGAAACDYKWYVSVDGDLMGDALVDGELVDSEDFGKLVNANKTDDNDCFLQECIDAASALRTGNGVLTQVYIDGTRSTVHVSVIHYYPAEVLRVNNDDDEDRSITLSNLDSQGEATTKHVFETEDFDEDDIVAYAYSKKSEAIEEVHATELLEGTVSQARAYESEDDSTKEGDHFTVDGTKYNYNKTVSAGAPRRLTTENVNNNMVGYLDQYGYVIYIDDAAATYDYAYVLTMGNRQDEFGSLNNNASRVADGLTWYARLVLTDGTVLKVETDAKTAEVNSLLHHLVSYSVDSNNIYSLHSRSDGIGGDRVKVDTGAAGMFINNKSYTANADTVFIIADSDEDSADDFNFRVYTGIANVPDIKNWTPGSAKATQSTVAVGANGIAKVVYVQDGDVSGSKNVIFIEANKEAKFDKTTGSSRSYVLDAVEDGEVVTLLVKENSEAAKKLVNNISDYTGYPAFNTKGTMWIVAAEYLTRDSDGIVTNVKLYNEKYEDNLDGDGYLYTTGTLRAERGTVGLGTDRKGYSDSTVVVRYDVKSGDFFPESTLNGIKDDKDDNVLGVLDTGTLTGICYLNTTTGAGEKPVAPVDQITITIAKVDSPMTLTINGTKYNSGSMTVDKGSDVKLEVTGTVPSGKVLSVIVDGATVLSTTGTYDITNIDSAKTVSVTIGDQAAAPAIDDQFKGKVNIVVKDADGNTISNEGYTVTDAHIVTTDEASATGGKYNAKSIPANALYLAFDMPENINIGSIGTVSLVSGGYTYPNVTVTNGTDTTGSWYGHILSSNQPAELVAGKDTTITITVPVSGVATPVVFELDPAYTLDYSGTNTSKNIVANGSNNIAVKFNGIDDDIFASVTVKYEITGLKDGPLTGESDVNNCGSGTFTDSTLVTASGDIAKLLPADGATEIKVKLTVEGKTVKAAIDRDKVSDYVTGFTADSGSPLKATETYAKGATLNLFSGLKTFTLKTNMKDVTVRYTLDGVTAADGNEADTTGLAKIDGATGAVAFLKGDGSTVGSGKATFTVNGDAVVKLTITEVVGITFDKTAFNGIRTAAIDNETSLTAAAQSDIELIKQNGAWVNKTDVVLELTPTGTFSTGNAKAEIDIVKFANYSGEAATLISTATTASGSAAISVTLTAEKLEIEDFENAIQLLISPSTP